MPPFDTRFVHWPELDLITRTVTAQPFQRHIHESYCIGLVERGARIISTRNAEIRVSPGEIFVLNPGQPHACRSLHSGHCYHVISVTPSMMQAFSQRDMSHLPHFRPVRIADRPIAGAIRRFCALAERDHDPIERETLLAQILTRLIAQYSDPSPEFTPPPSSLDSILRAQDYISTYYTHKLSLTHLADLCHLSPYHFQRTFVECVGLSPHDYQLHLRIKHSKRMLRQGLPVAVVAQNVGFVDQSHFTHSFKRLVGITPGCFARQYQLAVYE